MTNQPRLKAAIKAAMIANIPSPTAEQLSALDVTAGAIATAVIFEITHASLVYSTGLVAPSGGGPVTGTLNSVVIS